jgi:hypothetical protein
MIRSIFSSFIKEAAAISATPPKDPRSLNKREKASVMKQVLEKKANALSKIPLNRANWLHNLDHVNELAGLGTLAVPSVQHLRGHEMDSNTAHGMEAAGLGILAAPYAGRLAGAASPRLANFAAKT